jgi:hypothetical protein
MYKLYSTTTSALKSRNNHSHNKRRNITTTTTTGLFSYSRIQTTSTDLQERPQLNISFSSKFKASSKESTLPKQINSFRSPNHKLSRNKTEQFYKKPPSTKANKNNNNDMRKLKLKLHKLINHKPTSQCSIFEYRNEFFNRKLNDYFRSEKYLNNKLQYHKNFHFDKNDLGEAHDRMNMILNLKSEKDMIKCQYKIIKDDFNKQFSDEEKEAINHEPSYFIPNKQLNNRIGIAKHKTLIETLNEEEEIEIKRNEKHHKKRNDLSLKRRRYMTTKHKQILNEISKLKETEFDDIKFSIEQHRFIELQNHLHKTKSGDIQTVPTKSKCFKHNRVKSFQSKSKLNKEFECIKNAVNLAHNKHISEYHKERKRKNHIEKELLDLNSKILCLDKKIFPLIPIQKEKNLTETFKKDYSLKVNQQQLSKIENFINKDKNEDPLNNNHHLENEFLLNYTTKLKNQYKNNNNNI